MTALKRSGGRRGAVESDDSMPKMEIEEVARLAARTNLTRYNKHLQAQHAFNQRGLLYKAYHPLLQATRINGSRIISEEMAQTLVENLV